MTKEKIKLGKIFFHETPFSILSPFEDAQKTFSCATYHHVNAGSQSGLRQGIGNGGVGFRFNREVRMPNADHAKELSNVQEIKKPTLYLEESEINYLMEVAENPLLDDNMDPYVPAFVTSGACFPNNDYLS